MGGKAVKRMKKRWEGWDECKKTEGNRGGWLSRFQNILPQLKVRHHQSLRAIPFHPNIIPLYDFFLLPASKELYFVFESMEGNLYHLIEARKDGR
jgi:hypothetical protein